MKSTELRTEGNGYGTLPNIADVEPENSRKPATSRLAIGLFFLAITIGSVALYGAKDKITGPLLLDAEEEIDDYESEMAKTELTWSFSRNGYDPLTYFTADASEFLKYKFLKNFNAVIEPHAPMNLYIAGYSTKSKFYYNVEICSNSTSFCQTGGVKTKGHKIMYETIKFGCDPFEEFTVSLSKLSNNNDRIEKEYTGRAICMYVRREIRSLSEANLNATMDAMYALWSTDEDKGQELYGDGFRNISYLLQMHHFNAAWRDADHFHEVS